jgi:hypothetical protein
MRADIHTHAVPASGDSRMDIAQLAAAAQGIDAIALTDHLPGTDFEAAAAALASVGTILIPGREISCALGHVLVLATDAAWLCTLPPHVALPLPGGRRGEAALVWAHPGGWRTGGAMAPPDPARGAEHVHGVEVLNGERLWQDGGVAIARRLAADLGVPECGGSDAHDAAGVGRCLTEAPGAHDALSFIEALVAGAVRPVLSTRWAAVNDVTYVRDDLIGSLG